MNNGQVVLRVEDRPLLMGTAEFVDDLEPPGTLHVRFLRSPAAHAEITSLGLDAARGRRGVRGAFGAADVPLGPLHPPMSNPLAFSPPRPLLAAEVVRFVGEPVALVVADSPYLAEDAVNAIELTLNPLPVAVDPRDPDAPAIHAGGGNVVFDNSSETGEVAEAFDQAEVVIERSFRNPRYCATPIEPRGALAVPDGDGLRIWSSTQIPHVLCRIVAELLGLPRERVRVTVPIGRRRLRPEGARLPGGDPRRLAGADDGAAREVGRGPDRESDRLEPRP